MRIDDSRLSPGERAALGLSRPLAHDDFGPVYEFRMPDAPAPARYPGDGNRAERRAQAARKRR